MSWGLSPARIVSQELSPPQLMSHPEPGEGKVGMGGRRQWERGSKERGERDKSRGREKKREGGGMGVMEGAEERMGRWRGRKGGRGGRMEGERVLRRVEGRMGRWRDGETGVEGQMGRWRGKRWRDGWRTKGRMGRWRGGGRGGEGGREGEMEEAVQEGCRVLVCWKQSGAALTPPPSTALPPTASPGVIGSPLIAHTAMTPLPKKPHRVYPPIGFIPTPAPTHLSRFGWQGSAGTPLRWGGGGAVVVVFIGGGRGGTVVVVFSGAGGWGCYSVAAERKALSQGWERAPLAPEWDIWGKKKRKKN